MKQIILFCLVFQLFSCNINPSFHDELLSTIKEPLLKKILKERNSIFSNFSNLERFPNNVVDSAKTQQIKYITLSVSSIHDTIQHMMKSEQIIKADEIKWLNHEITDGTSSILSIIDEFKNQSAYEYLFRNAVTQLNIKPLPNVGDIEDETLKVTVLVEIGQYFEAIAEIIEATIILVEGEGMVVQEIEPIVAVLRDQIGFADDGDKLSILLTAYNNKVSPQFYVGEIDKSKIDVSKPFKWSKAGLFSKPPLLPEHMKLKVSDGIGVLGIYNSSRIEGVVEVLTSKGLMYLPFLSESPTEL